MQINPIWPELIGVSQKEDLADHEKLTKFIYDLEDTQSFNNGENLGYVTDEYLHTHKEVDSLTAWILGQVFLYTEQIGWKVDPKDIFPADSWAVVSKNGASTHRPHVHSNTLLSVVYYLKVPKGSAPLGFLNPGFKFRGMAPDVKERTSITEGEFWIEPKEGQCVIFRSDIPHMTGLNQFEDTTAKRISVAYTFNFKSLGQYSKGKHYGMQAYVIDNKEKNMSEANKQPAQDNANLTISDLKSIASIIDLATSRGAFRANELKTVGTVFEKVQAFLTNVEGQMKSAAEATEAAKQEAPTEEKPKGEEK